LAVDEDRVFGVDVLELEVDHVPHLGSHSFDMQTDQQRV
jgi:hypothetical protein